MKEKLLALTTVVLLIASTVGSVGQAQNPPDLISRRTRSRGIADPNLAASAGVNVRDKNSQVAAPDTKAPTTGRTLCSVLFDNYTDLFTKAYIDGKYAGTIQPFGELTAFAVPGSTVLYARAEFDDGTADDWGPARATCGTRARYVWRLTD